MHYFTFFSLHFITRAFNCWPIKTRGLKLPKNFNIKGDIIILFVMSGERINYDLALTKFIKKTSSSGVDFTNT